MTRIPSPIPERRTHRITIRMTKGAYGDLVTNARCCGTSAANYARVLLHEASPPVAPPSQPDGMHVVLINELKRIGNNLNQLTHAANAGLPPHVKSLTKTLQELIALLLENELTGPRIRETLKRPIANDSSPSQKGIELQRGVRLYPARPGQEFDA